jgi:hypothetical protein
LLSEADDTLAYASRRLARSAKSSGCAPTARQSAKRACEICAQPIRVKYRPGGAAGKWSGGRLAKLLRGPWRDVRGDLVVPVPTDGNRRLERGFNPAALPAVALAVAVSCAGRATCWCLHRSGRKRGCSRSKSGRRSPVARLPHGQAAKLTSYASYW